MEDLREKDAEIERLRNLINSSAESMQAVIDEQRQLICELADALVKEDQNYVWYNEGDPLIQRAREAFK